MERIPIKLREKLSLPHIIISEQAEAALQFIIQKAKEAKEARASKTKKADDRILQSAIAALLESPNGISRTDLLAISESNNLISIVAKLRHYFRVNNIYTLIKRGSGDSTTYIIEKL